MQFSFRVISPCMQDASRYNHPDVDFFIEEDRWNDYWYYTLYHLHATNKLHADIKVTEYLGSIHIMKIGQKVDQSNLLRDEVGSAIFHSLPDEFVSMTFAIDLYRGINRLLPERDDRVKLISALRMILSENDIFYQKVQYEMCFKKSLLRWGDMSSPQLMIGRNLLLQEGCNYNLRQKEITVHFNNSDDPLMLKFARRPDENKNYDGTIVFIGKNGSGKSTSLYKIASLMYTNPSERRRLKESIGTIEPRDIAIEKLMIFSYTPFDNFVLPGQDSRQDLIQWSHGIENFTGRFVFCGFRDVKSEAEEIIKRLNNEEANKSREDLSVEKVEEELYKPKISHKNISVLSEESFYALSHIDKSNERRKQLSDFILLAENYEPSFYNVMQCLKRAANDSRQWDIEYCSLSTGHKFMVHTILHIIAYCEDNSLLMFDEPENHLQAPLLSFMMHSIRVILCKRNSVMLVATHSPVILQETLSDNIRIVRRNGDYVTFSKPSVETFGSTFSEISSEVFDMTTDRNFFFESLRDNFIDGKCADMENFDDVVDYMVSVMGNISTQGLQYIVSLFFNKN